MCKDKVFGPSGALRFSVGEEGRGGVGDDFFGPIVRRVDTSERELVRASYFTRSREDGRRKRRERPLETYREMDRRTQPDETPNIFHPKHTASSEFSHDGDCSGRIVAAGLMSLLELFAHVPPAAHMATDTWVFENLAEDFQH